MIVGQVLCEDSLGVALVVENDVVGAASSDCPDHALGERVRLSFYKRVAA